VNHIVGLSRIALGGYLVFSFIAFTLFSSTSSAEIACGEPNWDRHSESGTFLWRTCDTGEWQVRMVAGGQTGGLTYVGRVRTEQPFTNLVPISIESNDLFAAPSGATLDFALRVGSPWYDGFTFNTVNGASACFELESGTPSGSTVLVGPERTPVTPPFDTVTLAACAPARSACGKPDTDASDQGIFLWQDCSGNGEWNVTSLAAESNGPVTYTGLLTTTGSINGVSGTSFENDDILDTSNPQQVSFRMKTVFPWYDAFAFSVDATDSTCFDIASPAGAPLFVGAYKTAVEYPLELSTLSSCGGIQAMIDNVTISEGDDVAIFTVSLSAAASETVRVNYETVGDTATSGVDFVQTGGTLVFQAGELSRLIEVPLIQDSEAEGSETFSLVLSNPSGVALSDATGIGTITDDEISACGKPSFDSATTEALFIWQDCDSGEWSMQVSGGGNDQGATYLGWVETDQQLTNLSEFSLESSDSLQLNPAGTRLQYQLKVWNKALDGFSFEVDNRAGACFSSLASSSGAGATVYLGAAQYPVTTPFDLNTLGKCQSNVDTTKPNFIVILTDDQRFDTLWAMPILQEKVQSRGTTFERAYVSTPLCCPSRGAFFSGFYPYNTGVLGNPGDNGGAALFQDGNTLAVAMQEGGYRTQFVGKYLNGYAPKYVPPGWSSWTANNRGPAGDDWHSFDVTRGSSSSTSAVGQSVHIEQYVTNFHRDEVLSFLGQVGQDPFFIVLAPYAPHAPATPDAPDESLFSDYVYRGRSYHESDLSDKPYWVANPNAFSVLKNPDDEFHRDMLRSLQAVDRSIGDIHDMLAQLGKLDNTVIIFTSDNGFLWGEHSITEKGNAYEESLLVPLVMAGPGIPATTDAEHLVSPDLDIAATVIDMAGVDRPEADGRSLTPLFGGGNVSWRDALVHQSWGRHPGAYGVWSAISDGRWKFIDNPGSVTDELYDLQSDPYEEENQIRNNAHSSIKNSLAQRLAENRGVSTTVFDAPGGKVGENYSFNLSAWGGTPPYKWSIYNGRLPAGLSLHQSGVISGTPTAAGSTTFKLKVVSQATATQSGMIQRHVEDFTIVIDP